MPLYPPFPAFKSFQLKVSPLHTLHVEQAGNPQGKPIVFLHGGPGGGIDAKNRQYFNPEKWHIILFDQRGSGKSTPHACLEENTTWDLVADIEHIREHLGITNWHVFGGSWGSTLALAYAIKHPERVKGLILRGIFMLREEELSWFYQKGASFLFPDLWEPYEKLIPEEERHDFITAYYKRLTSEDPSVRAAAAKTWTLWEGSTSKLLLDPYLINDFSNPTFAAAFARIECHYFTNKGFFDTDTWILDNAHQIAHIPGVIVHGRYDVVCPVKNAYDLHKVWPKARLEIIPDAGHSAGETGILEALIKATDEF